MDLNPYPELGFYIVPGHIPDSTAAFAEIEAGERLVTARIQQLSCKIKENIA